MYKPSHVLKALPGDSSSKQLPLSKAKSLCDKSRSCHGLQEYYEIGENKKLIRENDQSFKMWSKVFDNNGGINWHYMGGFRLETSDKRYFPSMLQARIECIRMGEQCSGVNLVYELRGGDLVRGREGLNVWVK